LPPRDQVRDYLLSFDLFEQIGRPEEGRHYVALHLDRVIKTVQLLPRLEGRVRVLELGASPYFMTCLIQKYLGYEIIPANFFGDYGEIPYPEDQVTIRSARFGEIYTFRYKMFNIELAPFPYQAGEFEMVLCCEILEHLVMDPSHMLHEIHRVLKPGGYLVITTPNLISLENMLLLLRGQSFLHPYSGYGVYGRHNREYTPRELDMLLRLQNFVPTIVVEDVYQHTRLHRCLTSLGPLQWRRDTLFTVAQAVGSPVQHYPDWLYSSQWGRRRVTHNTIVMGNGEVFQLGSGWYDYEDWPPGIRWTGREAFAFLKLENKETTFGFRACPGPTEAHGQVWINGHQAGTFALAPGADHEVVVPLPEEVRVGIVDGTVAQVEVRLCVENPFIPAQTMPGSTDQRELGIAVERLWLA